MLYVFAGFPQTGLHAGGLSYCIEEVEELAVLEHDPAIQYRKEGVFAANSDELLYPVEYRVSNLCLRDGITWNWFSDSWCFGNGVTVHKTMASPEYRTVIHGTDLTLDEYLATFGSLKAANMELRRKHEITEGWEKYEARWIPGTCPQETHVVHLTWLVTTHRLPEFAYERIRNLIEGGAAPLHPDQYSTKQGKHFSGIRRFDGKPSHGETHALPIY